MIEPTVADYTNFEFYEVAKVNELPPGERIFIEVDNKQIVIFNIAGLYFAIGDVCTHDNGPLGDGELDCYQIICPRHGARFDVRTGKAVRFPAVKPTPSYPVKVTGDAIEIGFPV
ncbi:MAG: non-heme iron oxygenase ferredoxin subunit [Planctomycetes bacterium]|nr:non-heme iron oxygenase ferredoxin subunit [Planctomycetota bacterium]